MNQIAMRSPVSLTPTHRAARTYLQFVSNSASALLGIGVSVLLGFNPLPASFPLLTFTRNFTIVVVVVGGALLALVMAALVVAPRDRALTLVSARAGARLARFFTATIISTVGSGALSILFGLNALPSTIPLLNLIRTHPPLGIALIALPLALIIFSPLFALPEPDPETPRHGGRSPLLLSISISTVSTVLFAGLLATVLTRPAWCPSAICPPPVVTHNPGASYDANLEIFPNAVQSATFAIPGDPTTYAIATLKLPEQIAAWRIDEAYPPYRVVVGVHSLRLGATDDISIEQVQVVIDAVSPPPDTLNVWNAGSDRDYGSNPYEAIYRGEPAGSVLQAFSTQTPVTTTFLREGETDEIDIQVVGRQAAQVRFHIRLVYRVNATATLRTLDLKQAYNVIFGSAANWHVYQPENGTFAPQG